MDAFWVVNLYIIIVIGLVGVLQTSPPWEEFRHREKAERRLCKLNKKAAEGLKE